MKKITSYEWLKNNSNHNDSKCLIYPFSKNWDGYGRSYHKGKCYNAHRLMCIIAHGESPSPKHQAAHKCGITSCVNPNHLYWATPSQNMQDNVRSGKHRTHVLSPGTKKFIRLLIKDGMSQFDISKIVGVSPRAIRFVQDSTSG